MNEIVKEWLLKAEGDFHVAKREFEASEPRNFDAICFHAQQCIEKTMKAVLIHHERNAPRVHNLSQLDDLIREVCPTWTCEREELFFLSQAGVSSRYPGEWANEVQAERAVAISKRMREPLLKLIQ